MISTIPERAERLDSRTLAVLATLAGITLLALTYGSLPVGLLTFIAGGLDTDAQGVGLLVSAYSTVIMIGAIPLSAMTVRFDPRKLLVGMLLVLAVTTAGVAAFPTLPVAIMLRALSGAAHAIAYTCVFRLAIAVVGDARRNLGASVVSGGGALAIIGIPIATSIGIATSWQMAFFGMAGLFAALAGLVLLLVPRHLHSGVAVLPATAIFREVLRPRVLLSAGVVVLILGAHNLTFTYIEPILRAAQVTDAWLGAALLAFGIAGIISLVVVSPLAARWPTAMLAVCLAASALSIAALFVFRGSPIGTVAALTSWGLFFGAVPVLAQMLTLEAARDLPAAAPSVFNMSLNVGVTLGAMIGGQLITSLGTNSLSPAGALIMAIGFVLVFVSGIVRSRTRRGEPVT